jgi:hypothetical protein
VAFSSLLLYFLLLVHPILLLFLPCSSFSIFFIDRFFYTYFLREMIRLYSISYPFTLSHASSFTITVSPLLPTWIHSPSSHPFSSIHSISLFPSAFSTLSLDFLFPSSFSCSPVEDPSYEHTLFPVFFDCIFDSASYYLCQIP